MPPVPVVRQIRPAHLIEAARFLIDHHEAQGRPRQAYLRRAVSTAYYALFHYLCWETSCHLLPDGTTDERLAVVRSIDHGAVRKVCEWIADPRGAPAHVGRIVGALTATTGILNLALAFPDLQQARHEADYDHLRGFSKPEAIQFVDAAETAVQSLRAQTRARKAMLFALIAMEIKKVQ